MAGSPSLFSPEDLVDIRSSLARCPGRHARRTNAGDRHAHWKIRPLWHGGGTDGNAPGRIRRHRAQGRGGRAGGAPAAVPDDQVIQQLVLINRMLSSREMGVLGAYGHVSVRSRTNPNHYFIARAVSPGLVTARDVYESDLDSNPVSADRNQSAPRTIHARRDLHGRSPR
jgi:hypothetical protein